MSKQRLELDWIGKDIEHILEPRILLEQKELSFGKKDSKNLIIQGDNLLALKALESDFRDKISCIFIDPPYNTGAAFDQYDDGVEHSIWLSLMRNRILRLHKLLEQNGSLWITIDDNEAHYLKIICDEIFGRKNFVANIVWQKRTSPDIRATVGAGHDHILVFAKNIENFKKKINKLPFNEEQKSRYKNPDDDPRGPWASVDMTGQTGHATPSQFYSISAPNKTKHAPPDGRCWAFAEATVKQFIKEGRVWFGADGNSRPRLKKYLSDSDGVPAWTWWPNSEVGHNQEAKKESIELFGAGKAFDTPKPERLLERIIHLATSPGDMVLDSFAGSGTTAAVAHKMLRNWITIEVGDHCQTHVIPRLKKVIDGKDEGGITANQNWTGGGGFKFMTLAPSLLEKDDRGQWIISKKYDSTMLASAVCKHEGFKFHPDQKSYWKQGYSTEKDFIFVTTQFLTSEQIQRIHDLLKPDESLLICAKAFKVPSNKFDRITLKKIPQSLLTRGVEFGRDDYSLNVKEPVQEEMGMDTDL